MRYFLAAMLSYLAESRLQHDLTREQWAPRLQPSSHKW